MTGTTIIKVEDTICIDICRECDFGRCVVQ